MEVLLSIAGSILGSLASKAAEYTVDPIAQQLSYLFKPRSKFQNLRTKVDQLKDARERVQQSVHDANRNGKEIFGDVDRWLTEVNGKISEQAATPLQVDEEKAKKRCFAGFCPNFKSRYQLSKKAEKEAKAIAELLGQKNEFDRVSYPPVLDPRPAIKEYEAFESRSGALNGVSEALKDNNCNIIGVYGMGGVGKTTLVKEVFKQAKEKQLFDEVVFVAVTQTPNTENIQNEIAEKLGLKYDVESIDMRAAQLRNRLKKDKKILIILDDIWVTLNLDALGIPSRDEHKGCKILMTSRKLDVLQSMDSQKNIPIDILKEVEAWNLFKNIAGDIVERSNLQSIAIKISKKCAGLPIAITTVAKALKHKENLFEWKNALRELRRPSERNFKRIPADAYSAIELSYKFLEVEEHRPIFLLCSIMGHNAAIEDLLRYGMGLGLFRDVYTMEETRNRVLTLVSNLKASCLLLDGSNQEHFDMHDVVRDVAISIASRDHRWLALGRDDEFKEWSDEEKMKNYSLISLRQYAKVSELLDHNQLGCPNLTFFSLNSEDSSLKIPDNFFLGVERLKFLDFTKMHFSSLHLSMGFLKNIHTLCLTKCKLDDIVFIGELRTLEILNLRQSDIAKLPREIGHLTKLKLLDLSDCRDLVVISPNVLSSLSRLEELYLYHSFDRWVVEGIDDPRSNASLVELQHLSHLTTLEVHIPNEQAMSKDYLFSKKLERYKISIGMKWEHWRDRMETSRMMKVKTNRSIHLYDRVKTLLRNTENLYLDGVKDVMNMLYEPTTEGLPQIKHLHVSNVKEIKFVFNSLKLVSCLESLSLDNLIHLEAIFYGQLKAGSFGRLKVIKVGKCKMLNNLFSFSMAKELHQLQEIWVSNCENMVELIVEKRDEEIGGNEEVDNLKFSQLRSLELRGLQSLIGLCHSKKKFSSSQHGRVQSSATCLFDEKVVFPAMEELHLESINSIEKLWHDQVPVMSFGVQNLTTLEVRRCHKLKYAFTSSMVKSFVQLKSLIVEDGDEMVEVIEGILGGEERVSSSIMVFPKLQYLTLKELPKLVRFCYGINPIEFSALRKLKITECPVLSTFHCDSTSIGEDNNLNLVEKIDILHCLFNEKVVFPAVEELHLESINSIEKLWYDQVPVMSFGVQNLTTLEVRRCHKLKYVFTSSMVKSFVQLKRLIVDSCEEMEEVIEGILRGEEEGISSGINTVFPKLRFLELSNLSNLKRFWCGVNPIKFPILSGLKIRECPVLSTFHCDSTNIGNSSISMDHNLNIDIPVSHYLFNQKVSLPMLQYLHIASLKKLERLWPNQFAKDSFSELSFFLLEDCDKLLNVFPLSMLTKLQHLKQLSIGGCKLLEEIIGEDDDDKVEDDEITFPLFSSLILCSLPKLESFCSSGNCSFGFPSLKTVIVKDCSKLRMFTQGSSSTPLLHKVQLENDEVSMSSHGSLNSAIQQLLKERSTAVEDDEEDGEIKKENYEQDQDNLSTSIIQNLRIEMRWRFFLKYEVNSYW